ncbi:hypothetical protein [Mesorhizobium sp. M0589]|uniref:hypothetical protein n=1 Tax=Mesorhizobium sp. M0589 TaxID=2956965 RepID=UPI00333D5894
MSGKWNQEGVPHKGWTCVDVDDLGEPSETCEMCEAQEIRYVHYMSHPHYPAVLGVGCVCAENMENDYAAPKERERRLRGAAARRQRWLTRKWRTSRSGNSYLNTGGFNITVFPQGGSWGGRILERQTQRSVDSRRTYATAEAAKLGAFDGMVFLEGKGWGRGSQKR